MICGLVAITPAAGYVNGFGAMMIGVIASSLVWVAWYTLPKYVWPFKKVDDALGVVYTHGIAGLLGGLLVGLFADPKVIVYLGVGNGSGFSGAGLFYGHPHQLLVQFEAALTIIIWDAAVTFLIFMIIKYVFRMQLRLPGRGAGDRRRRGARRGGLPVRRSGRRRHLDGRRGDHRAARCPRGRTRASDDS